MASEAETKAILAQHEDALSGLPNVVGLGVVADRADAAKAAVAVYVSTKRPEAQLRPAEIVPRTLRSVLDGKAVEAPTQVIEVGTITF